MSAEGREYRCHASCSAVGCSRRLSRGVALFDVQRVSHLPVQVVSPAGKAVVTKHQMLPPAPRQCSMPKKAQRNRRHLRQLDPGDWPGSSGSDCCSGSCLRACGYYRLLQCSVAWASLASPLLHLARSPPQASRWPEPHVSCRSVTIPRMGVMPYARSEGVLPRRGERGARPTSQLRSRILSSPCRSWQASSCE